MRRPDPVGFGTPIRAAAWAAEGGSPGTAPAAAPRRRGPRGGPGAGPGRRAGRARTPPAFFFQAEDGIRGIGVTGVQTCALPILSLRLAKEGYSIVGIDGVKHLV